MPDTESGAIIDKASLSQTVSVFYTNCNDLRNKMGELMMVPETYGSNLKIICVTETMFDSDMQTAEINCSDSIAICVETDPYPFILVCVYRSQSLTHEENQEIIEQITKITIKENHE